jgi:hypothetical protein
MAVGVWRRIIGMAKRVQSLVVRAIWIERVCINAPLASGYSPPPYRFNHWRAVLAAYEPLHRTPSQRINRLSRESGRGCRRRRQLELSCIGPALVVYPSLRLAEATSRL